MDAKPFLNDDFAQDLIRLSNEAVEFTPILYYDADGDCIEFIAEPHSHDAQRINSLLTVYLSTETGRLIGSRIKGVKQLIRRRPYVRIAVKDGKVRLDHLIVAGGSPENLQEPMKPGLNLDYEALIRELADLASEREFDAPELCEA
jgi:hypothetical protein